MKLAEQPALKAERTFMGHPVGLYTLFFTEMWERFSFYSMRGFLVLYMTSVMVFDEEYANGVYGAYLGFVYATTFLGGILADRILGQRLAIYVGGVMMALAQLCLMFNALMMKWGYTEHYVTGLFFVGLGLLSAGNGFFKPNISTIVGTLYKPADGRRDSAFTIFYMGINIGAALAGLSGQAAQSWGWYWGFMLAGIGMVFSLVVLTFCARTLQGKGLPPRDGAPWERVWGLPKFAWIIIATLVVVPTIAFLVFHPTWVQSLAVIIAGPVLLYLIWEATRGTREERDQMIVIIVLCSFSMMFWSFFELAGSMINLFTDQRVHLPVITVFGKSIELQASLLTASLNPLFILVFGIPFARLWVWLNNRNKEPSSPLKFSFGLLQLALGFALMAIGAERAGDTGKCHVMWIILGFLFHTTGELCLSPVGLSTITKLSPARLAGMLMGVWFMFTALGNVFGGWVAGRTGEHGYTTVFEAITVVGAAAGVLLLLLTPLLKRMMHGVK